MPIYFKQVSRSISSHFIEIIKFTSEEVDLAGVVPGFQDIIRLPYCPNATCGTHIPCKSCPEDQLYEFRCYKWFISIVLFAASDVRRKFIFTNIGRPGVFGYSSILDNCKLKANID